jgi:hypothetical protein
MDNKLIFKQMNLVMKEIGFVSKDQKNMAQGFKFRGIDQFVNALYPALCKHGVFIAPECVSESHELKDVERSSGKAGVDKHVHVMMKYNFYAEDGSSVTVGPIPAEGLDSGDKATNKSLSAALKYALIQTFSVPTEDMAEGDLETPEIKPSPVIQNKPVTVSPVKVTPSPTVVEQIKEDRKIAESQTDIPLVHGQPAPTKPVAPVAPTKPTFKKTTPPVVTKATVGPFGS